MSPTDVATPYAWCTLSVDALPPTDWDAFVDAQAEASVYHRAGWSLLAREVFGHRAFFIHARDAQGALLGILPIVQQKSLLGNFATSVAFFNYGGALSRDTGVAQALMNEARKAAQAAGCSYLELRDTQQRGCDWTVRTDKVSMMLELPGSFAKLSQQLGSKLRSQAKRAEREAASVHIGGIELLDDFYTVFASNMRDLGTPVYPGRFFAAILQRFPDYCRLVVIRHNERPAAAGFIVMYKGQAEIPWAACLADAKPLGFNMKLYWEVLAYVVGEGCHKFDFGRSTVNAGTYKFKAQWGAQPVQLYWHRWHRNAAEGSAPASESSLKAHASAMWQRLPVGIANVLGPAISPYLPW